MERSAKPARRQPLRALVVVVPCVGRRYRIPRDRAVDLRWLSSGYFWTHDDPAANLLDLRRHGVAADPHPEAGGICYLREHAHDEGPDEDDPGEETEDDATCEEDEACP